MPTSVQSGPRTLDKNWLPSVSSSSRTGMRHSERGCQRWHRIVTDMPGKLKHINGAKHPMSRHVD